MRFTAHEAEVLKQIIADETKPLLERIKKLEAKLKRKTKKCS